MTPAVPRFLELQAPPNWATAEFISDLHLRAAEPETFEAWRRYMQGTQAGAVFILGDLFDVWVGDDAAHEPGFAGDCAAVLRAAAALRPVFFMRGNRDFLVGPALMQSCGVTLLDDPTVLGFAGQRWLLTHGDALCLDDTQYMRFREQVRALPWQQAFLAKPLAERKAIARGMREQSEARKGGKDAYGDLDTAGVLAWLEEADAKVMIHGHTHRPAEHALPAGRERVVMSDWDAAAAPPRMQVLRLAASGLQRVALA